MRTTFIKTVTDIAEKDSSVVVLTGDLGFKIFDDLRQKIGPRFINAGVAEANMLTIAAGMAMSGLKPYCYSMVPFLTMRAFEQLRIDICSHNLPVTLVGIGAALGYAMEGATHHALEDIGVTRSIPGLTVVAPGDKYEVKAIIKRSHQFPGPLYVRLAKDSSEVVHSTVPELALGEAYKIVDGEKVVVLANGPMLNSAHELVERLYKQGHRDVGLYSMPTVKPLDMTLLSALATKAEAIITIEENSITAGFGSAVAENLLEMGYQGIFRRLGLPDSFFQEVGSREHLLRHVELDIDSIEAKVKSLISQISVPAGKVLGATSII